MRLMQEALVYQLISLLELTIQLIISTSEAHYGICHKKFNQ